MCILFVYTLLKVVNYYDFENFVFECLGFQKNKFGWRMGGWGGLHPSFFWIIGMFLTLQSP